jgi:hypothetical protein
MVMKEQAAQIELAKARTIADKGLGIERLSRVDENKALAVERMAEAQKDKDQALLNFVKALKEIETIDLMNIEKLITLKAMINNQEVSGVQNVMDMSQPPLTQESPL